LNRYEEATKECTAALKIESCYMKAILMRARCYNRMERYEESIADYNRWIHAVQEARRNPNFRRSDECPFDRAVDVTEIDFQKSAVERTSVEERRSDPALKARQAAEEGRRRAQSAHNRRQQYQDFQNQRRWDNANQTDVKKAYRKMIKQRRSDKALRERVERILEDVEDPIVLTTTEDNFPTAVAAHRINSRRRRIFYHEIIPAKIVDMGSSSTSILAGDPQNAPSWNPHGEGEYSGPAAIAVPERVVGMGLEPHSNRFEEVVINRPRFTFAVAGSVEMANLNVRQLNQHQNVDTLNGA